MQLIAYRSSGRLSLRSTTAGNPEDTDHWLPATKMEKAGSLASNRIIIHAHTECAVARWQRVVPTGKACGQRIDRSSGPCVVLRICFRERMKRVARKGAISKVGATMHRHEIDRNHRIARRSTVFPDAE